MAPTSVVGAWLNGGDKPAATGAGLGSPPVEAFQSELSSIWGVPNRGGGSDTVALMGGQKNLGGPQESENISDIFFNSAQKAYAGLTGGEVHADLQNQAIVNVDGNQMLDLGTPVLAGGGYEQVDQQAFQNV